MRRTALAVLLILFAACSSSRKDDQLPSTIPPPELHPEAAPDPRIDQMQTTLTELLDRLDVMNARIAKLEAQSSGEQSSGGQPPPAVQPTPARAVASRQAPRQEQPALHSAQIAEEYRRGIILVGQSRYADARAVFQRVFDDDPSGDLADNALFWMGETYFAVGDYSNAMRYYERVEKEYPDQNKAPDAVFKLGIAYEKTGDLGMARRTFEECVKKYPYSSPAAAARMEIKRIKY